MKTQRGLCLGLSVSPRKPSPWFLSPVCADPDPLLDHHNMPECLEDKRGPRARGRQAVPAPLADPAPRVRTPLRLPASSVLTPALPVSMPPGTVPFWSAVGPHSWMLGECLTTLGGLVGPLSPISRPACLGPLEPLRGLLFRRDCPGAGRGIWAPAEGFSASCC